MANFALLNNVDHQDVKIITARAARYGDDIMYAPVFPFEFRNVQAFYPILFHQDGRGEHTPVALFGFQERQNLFLSDTGWDAAYVPAMIRRQPFLIGFQDVDAGGRKERVRVLSLDMAHPRVNKETGEALFAPLGGRTPFLEDMADLLETIHEGLGQNGAFVAAMRKHDLLEPVTFDIGLSDGARNQLLGFHCLNEERVQALPGSVLGEFNEAGLLMPMFMTLASLANVARLVERVERASRVEAESSGEIGEAPLAATTPEAAK